MVCLILNGRELPHSEKLVEALIKIPGMTSITVNINESRTNVILGRHREASVGDRRISRTRLERFPIRSLNVFLSGQPGSDGKIISDRARSTQG